jgi:RHS repeat-associated protein
MRTGGTLYYTLSDHLGSTSLTTDASGIVLSEMRYTAWGEVRHNAGVTPTNYTYTRQYSNTADFGLMFYNARWYDPALGRFAQADSIIPGAGDPQAWDRYAYVDNSPLNYTDPSGHRPCEDYQGLCLSENQVTNLYEAQQQRIRERSEKKNKNTGPISSVVDLDDLEWNLTFTKYALSAVDYLSQFEDLINSHKPKYKHVKWAFGTGFAEAIIDGLLYGVKDREYVNLSDSRRVGRMSVIAVESFVIRKEMPGPLSSVKIKGILAIIGGVLTITFFWGFCFGSKRKLSLTF